MNRHTTLLIQLIGALIEEGFKDIVVNPIECDVCEDKNLDMIVGVPNMIVHVHGGHSESNVFVVGPEGVWHAAETMAEPVAEDPFDLIHVLIRTGELCTFHGPHAEVVY